MLLGLLLLCLSLVAATEFSDVRGGVLFKNSKQTSCEVGLISMKAGFIAASCLDYTSGTNINRSTKYEIYLQAGSPKPLVVTLDPSDVHLHPNFNPSTLQNNIAVIEFNKQTTDTYKAYIVSGGYSTSSAAYVSRSINQSTGEWENNIVAEMKDNPGDPNDCLPFSGLFSANTYQFVCIPITTTSIKNSSCRVPYGTVYAKGKNGIVSLVAINSFTVATSPSLCDRNVFSYTFLLNLWDLDEFATSVLGYPIDIMVNFEAGTQTGTALYSNNFPKFVDMTGKTTITGDIYALEADSNNDEDTPADTSSQTSSTASSSRPSESSSSSSSNSSSSNDNSNDDTQKTSATSNDTDNTDNTDNSEDTEDEFIQDTKAGGDDDKDEDKASGQSDKESDQDGDENNDEDSSQSVLADEKQNDKDTSNQISNQQANAKEEEEGLNKTQITTIAIVVPVVVLLCAVIAYIVYRLRKAKKTKKQWDPLAEANQHREAIFDLGGVGVDTNTPPPYQRHSETASSLNIGAPYSSDLRENSMSKDEKP
ncbi:hypothetical protein GGF40_002857 [Coemansia sp. RSA 1286]|nr:hypothetical protein GGF40_002857 [Coemansia sp. RSA 1286]